MNKFDTFFQDIYRERWSSLKLSLQERDKQVRRPVFVESAKTLSDKDIFSLPAHQADDFQLTRELNENNLKKYYIMDPASILCAMSLEIGPSDFVLDMCAAPGGKSLILLEKLKTGTLWANEISANRRSKLKSVIQDYVPRAMREKIFIKGKDGNRYGLNFVGTFDKILVDAPCSGEKHLLASPKEIAKWTPSRTKRLATAQYSLLCSALLSCKEGGQIVYSTCSISPLENDHIIEKILLKKGERVELNLPKIDLDFVERTKFGYIILPDKAGFGPIFFSRLQKKETQNLEGEDNSN